MYELTMHSAAAMAQTHEATRTTVEQLAHEHGRLVFRICWAVSRNHHDAEDASQEVFLRVLKHEKELASLEDAKAWLARIAWRVAIDRLPKKAMLSLSDEVLTAKIAELRASGVSAGTARRTRRCSRCSRASCRVCRQIYARRCCSADYRS